MNRHISKHRTRDKVNQKQGFMRVESLKKNQDSVSYLLEELVKGHAVKPINWYRSSKISCLNALEQLAKHRDKWIRPLKLWQPRSSKKAVQIKELIDHLLVKYPLPDFLYCTFFNNRIDDSYFVPLFISLAQGGTIKQIHRDPIFTQKMRVEFMKINDNFSLDQAYQYAIIKGLGGDDFLAYQLMNYRIGWSERGQSVYKMLIKIRSDKEMFEWDKLEDLIFFVKGQLTYNKNFSLKGYTLASLVRRSDEWNRQRRAMERRAMGEWKSARFIPFKSVEYEDGQLVTFKMEELLTHRDLIIEGAKMSHCVGSYAPDCKEGSTRIVSLRRYQEEEDVAHLATIEVDLLDRCIVQAKYRHNRAISSKAYQLMQAWAITNGLTINEDL